MEYNVIFVYSFSLEWTMLNPRPIYRIAFFDRYSPIPVEFAFFLLEPVKPFSGIACSDLSDTIAIVQKNKKMLVS